MKLQKIKYKKKFKNILMAMMGASKVAEKLVKIEGLPYFIPFNKVSVIKNSNKVRVKTSNKSTVDIKVGKYVNKILVLVGYNLPNSDIEQFVNLYTAISNFKKSFSDFKMVKGKDIKKYYHHSAYAQDKGVLGNSCMKHKRHQKYLKIYSKNKNKIGMLILKDSNGQIKGRAIVWLNINMRPGKKDDIVKVNLMDRIYSYDDSVTEEFKIYARVKGWVYKKNQNSAMEGPFIYKNNILPDTTKFYFYLDNFKKIKEYPYLDTLKMYSTKNGFISNRKFKNCVELTCTDGDHYVIDEDDIW